MNINSLSSRLSSSIGETNNPFLRAKLVISGDKGEHSDDVVKIVRAKEQTKADQLKLLEEAKKLSENLDEENENNKITTSKDNEDSAVLEPVLDTIELSGIMMIDNQKVAERFSGYQGSGNATTLIEVDEALSNNENWLFSFGRNIDREAAGINAQQGLSSGEVTENGYGMRVAYDTTSSEDNPIMIVETVDSTGSKTAYMVNLKEIDAGNASLVESFALISHLYIGQGKTEEEYQGFDALRLMNNIIDQPKYNPSKSEGVTYDQNGYSVTTPTKSGITTTNAPPMFEDRFNLLSFGQKHAIGQPKDKSLYL